MCHFISLSPASPMWLNTSTLQTTSLQTLGFFQPAWVSKPDILDARRKLLWTDQANVQLAVAAEKEDNIGIYRLDLLESSLRSAGCELQRGLPTSPSILSPCCSLFQISHSNIKRNRAAFFPWAGNVISRCVICLGQGFCFLFLFLNYFYFSPSLSILE